MSAIKENLNVLVESLESFRVWLSSYVTCNRNKTRKYPYDYDHHADNRLVCW